MPERVISGGQTGADQASWRSAKACGIPAGSLGENPLSVTLALTIATMPAPIGSGREGQAAMISARSGVVSGRGWVAVWGRIVSDAGEMRGRETATGGGT